MPTKPDEEKTDQPTMVMLTKRERDRLDEIARRMDRSRSAAGRALINLAMDHLDT